MTLGEFAYGQKWEVIDPMLACWIEKTIPSSMGNRTLDVIGIQWMKHAWEFGRNMVST